MYIPRKNNQHRPNRHLRHKPPKPFLPLPLRILENLAADFQQIRGALDGGGDFRRGGRDRTADLLCELFGQRILSRVEQVEGAADDGLALGEGREAVGVEGGGGEGGEQGEVGGGGAVAG